VFEAQVVVEPSRCVLMDDEAAFAARRCLDPVSGFSG
jgi:hypothetical protein